MSASNNVTDKTRLDIAKQYMEIQRKQRQLSGQMTQLKNRAKTMGINVKGMVRALAARDVDPDEALEEAREFLRFGAMFRLPLSLEELFPEGAREGEETVDKDVAQFEAYDAGYLAGSNGRSIDDSPYNGQPGTEVFVEWRKGWNDGQASIAYRLDGGETQANTERRPRGRPRTANKEEKGEGAGDSAE